MAALPEDQVRFWMNKAVQWGQATSLAAQQDTSKHLQSLESFLQQLLRNLQMMSSTTEAMKSLPFVGQFLGRLCWNTYVTADDRSRGLLLQCVVLLYSAKPQKAVEHKANEWIRNLLCHLISEEEGSVVYALEKHMGFTPKQYYLEAIKKIVVILTKEANMDYTTLPASSERRCSCLSIHAVTVACVPLVTCPEATSLIGALLKHRALCGCSRFSKEFIEAVNAAWLSKKLVIGDEAVVALWCHSLSSLERAVLSLLECVLSDSAIVMPNLEKVVSDTLLAKASALHCHVFLVVNDVFRHVVRTLKENITVRALIQVFTSCFLQARSTQRPQEILPLKAFFPHVPHNILAPLLTTASEVPKHAWLEHVSWIGTIIQRLYQEQEGEDDRLRWSTAVFEVWFFLVQCGHWIDVTAELLVSVGCEKSEPLLFLLMFYHNPTTRGHQSTQHIMMARQAWNDLKSLFLKPTLSSDQLSSLKEHLSSSPLTDFVLHLLLNFAIFSQASSSRVTEVIQKVLIEVWVKHRHLWMLSCMQQRLNRDGSMAARLRMLENKLCAV